MGNITSFFEDTGDFLSEWRLWLVSFILSIASLWSVYRYNRDNILSKLLKPFILIFIFTYIATFSLNTWLCYDNKGFDIKSMVKDGDMWYKTLAQSLVFTAVVTVASIVFGKVLATNMLSTMIFLAAVTVGFYFTYKGFQEFFNCKNYVEDNEELEL